MENTPKCYSVSCTSGAVSCEGCNWLQWCKGSSDPDPIGGIGRNRIYAKIFEGTHCIKEQTGEISELGALLGEVLARLDAEHASKMYGFFAKISALATDYPKLYQVVRLRITHPMMTTQEMALELGVNRATVSRHMTKALEMLPVLAKAFPATNEQLQHSEDMFQLRCSGGWLYVETRDGVVLKADNNHENNKNMGAIVGALNNMHWRKLNALLEELK